MIQQVNLIRTDLDISIGKTAAQESHASVMASESSQKINKNWHLTWRLGGQKKVVLAVESATKLTAKYKEAKK
ncbi:MAG: peptidyl-tRNA hydrolase, partial [Candidatus Nanoarchaeia archaeon]|nr:peptidyl-tRNA hydrolase [Candidatus Nanoarchaeia archaeon]